MKIKKMLERLMGMNHPPEILNQLEDFGFKDTGEVLGDYMMLNYQGYKVLYDREKDRVLDFYKVERCK